MCRSSDRLLVLSLIFAILVASCHPCPQPTAQAAPVEAGSVSRASGPPLIGISGYVIQPGTRGDEGLGNFRMTRTYRDAVAAAGGLPIHLVPVPAAQVGELLDRLDGLILAGGPDIDPAAYDEEPHPSVKVLEPERQSFDFALAREAVKRQMPILGICLGSQELNVALGGDMIQDIPSEVDDDVGHRKLADDEVRRGVHEITLVEGTPLAELYGQQKISVNSLHHQASDNLAEGLVVAARAADGVIEGFYRPDYPFLIGLQFHPEIQTEPPGLHRRLFQSFIEAAETFQRSRGAAETQ
jgi:putative glutamine amidotransferase